MSKEDSTKKQGLSNISQSTAFRFYWIAIVGVILYVVLDAVAQSLPPHYSPIRDAESDLAVGPYGYIMAINFLIRGILSLAFIFAFVKTIDLTGARRASFRTGYILMGVWAVGAILLAFFPTDVPATPMSWHGAIHFVVAIIAFIGGAFGAFALSRNFNGNPVLNGAKKIATPLTFLVLLFWVIEFFTPFVAPHLVTRFGGLFERLFLGSVLLWILSVSAYMVTHKRQIASTVTAS